MKCPICDCGDNWKNIDFLREATVQDFVVCKECGFVTYLHQSEAQLRSFYERSDCNASRKIAGTADYLTKLNKLIIHRAFLDDFLKESQGRLIIDIGCSTGYFLNMCRNEYGAQYVCGTEWNPVHAEFGRMAYGLEIHENISDFGEKKYDLICMEQVLEHILEPDEFLQMLAGNYLADDGRIYISVPIWFDILGAPSLTVHPGKGLEGILVPDHVNVFSLAAITNLYKRSGFRVEKENYSYYGYRALLVRAQSPEKIEKEDFEEKINILERQKAALHFFEQKRFGAALDQYDRFPDAVIQHAWKELAMPPGQRIEFFRRWRDRLPNVFSIPWQIASAYFEEGMYAEALEQYRAVLELNPTYFFSLWQIGEIYLRQEAYREAASIYETLLFNHPQFQFQPVQDGFPTCLDRLSWCYAKAAGLKSL